MSGRAGGKLPYQKKPKKDQADMGEDDLAFKKKQKEDAAKLKVMQLKAGQKGPLLGGGIKRSGKR
jgi:hypothetical protein